MRAAAWAAALTGATGCLETDGVLIEGQDAGVAGPSGPRACVCGALGVRGAVQVSDGLAVRSLGGAGGGLLVDGTFWVDAETLGSNAPITVDRLDHQGAIAHGDSLVTVGDAVVRGDLSLTGDLIVGGALRQPEGSSVQVGGAERVAARSFEVPAFEWPCDCAAPRLDTAERPDDRPGLALNRDALANVQAGELVVALGAGRYVFDGIGGPGTLRLQIDGAVDLLILGDVRPGGLQVEVGPDAHLAWTVTGDVSLSGAATIGDPARPDAVRLIIGGARFEVSAPTTVSAWITAPQATFGASVPIDWRGRIAVQSVSAAADWRIR